MAVVDVMNTAGVKVSEIELADEIYDVPVKVSVLHEIVTMQLARRRRGTASVKRRSDVKGSQKKLFRQKGTGRARRGNIKSPLLRGGGVVFGPSPRSYDLKIPKKVRRLGLKMALSSKLREKKITVVDEFALEKIKTRAFIEAVRTLEKPKALIVIDKKDTNLELSSRNVKGVKVLRSEGLNVYDILKYDDLILLAPSVKEIERRLLA